MLRKTLIEWCDYTWSPWFGCTKVSPGCINCYDEARDKRHLFGPETHWGKGAPRRLTKDWRKPVKWNRDAKLEWCEAVVDAVITPLGDEPKPRRWRKRVFPSVCDWLDDEVPIEWLARFLQLIHDTPNLDWLLLSKRPENFHERLLRALAHAEGIDYATADAWEGDVQTELGIWLNEWLSDDATPPSNVWIGTSVEDQTRADERIPALLKIPARIRFLSVKPLLGPVVLNHIDAEGSGSAEWCQIDALTGRHTDMGRPCPCVPKLDWVIIGGESGRGSRPCNVAWVRSIVKQCKYASVPCFVKQLGGKAEVEAPSGGWMQPIPLKHPKGGDHAEWPEDLRVRQFPSR